MGWGGGKRHLPEEGGVGLSKGVRDQHLGVGEPVGEVGRRTDVPCQVVLVRAKVHLLHAMGQVVGESERRETG